MTSEKVAAYDPMVEAHARRFASLPMMQNDFDDFCQMGRFGVWRALEDGFLPSNKIVTDRMVSWARTRNRQLRGESPLPEDDAEQGG